MTVHFIMHDSVTLPVPEHIKPFRENKVDISIDVEIVDTIKHLWENKICTLGCCQGDPEKQTNPSVIITSSYSDKDIDRIRKLIAEVDDREWDIYQWRLTKIEPIATTKKRKPNPNAKR